MYHITLRAEWAENFFSGMANCLCTGAIESAIYGINVIRCLDLICRAIV